MTKRILLIEKTEPDGKIASIGMLEVSVRKDTILLITANQQYAWNVMSDREFLSLSPSDIHAYDFVLLRMNAPHNPSVHERLRVSSVPYEPKDDDTKRLDSKLATVQVRDLPGFIRDSHVYESGEALLRKLEEEPISKRIIVKREIGCCAQFVWLAERQDSGWTFLNIARNTIDADWHSVYGRGREKVSFITQPYWPSIQMTGERRLIMMRTHPLFVIEKKPRDGTLSASVQSGATPKRLDSGVLQEHWVMRFVASLDELRVRLGLRAFPYQWSADFICDDAGDWLVSEINPMCNGLMLFTRNELQLIVEEAIQGLATEPPTQPFVPG
ncbi:hypothetical protein BTA51_09410 [Hahella sp. CCB-MM4]|uniref:Cj0069 family protein n=1 Tax=Hahella sp. (strain CCB-MM4) TaxID=1926491 RepID=UPI000B9A579A|nr:hypothetical protein [Hahella sp. CCB-MM4]OZG73987.1 hypothetical protein BTA51_09410 [Hahella sp. CCB-MM4]